MYTVWMYGRKIGSADLETGSGRRLAGIFHPTEFGLSVLPGITDMFPALVEFKSMCQRQGVDVEDPHPAVGQQAFAEFRHTPEGRRIVAAAKLLADIEVCDTRGDDISWDSLAISDMEALRALALRECPETVANLPPAPLAADVRYVISLTLTEPFPVAARFPC